jgi:hypothetical protein
MRKRWGRVRGRPGAVGDGTVHRFKSIQRCFRVQRSLRYWVGSRRDGVEPRKTQNNAPPSEHRIRRHAAPLGTSLLARTRMGPETPLPRNASPSSEKMPNRSLRGEVGRKWKEGQ